MAQTEIYGKSDEIEKVKALIARVAPTQASILIVGESGTGKELVARMIHEKGLNAKQPFVAVNCGAIPENLIESELFGHQKGSFTGAVSEKLGLFEVANGGTIFLDEIGELPLGMQVKLLRVLQDRSFKRVGGTQEIKVTVRVLSATNRDLEGLIKAGTFREDLYYRLNVIQIRVPPLRTRTSDIKILAEHFLKRANQRNSKNVTTIDPQLIKALMAYDWPGNVRELENVIERTVAFQTGKKLMFENLPLPIRESLEAQKAKGQLSKSHSIPLTHRDGVSGKPIPEEIRLPAPDFSKGPLELEEILGTVERTYLLAAMAAAGGVKKKAASLLGVTFRSIRYRLKKQKIKD